MKIVIITQEDSFAVPKNIKKILELDFAEVVRIININSSQSLVNKKDLFIKGFGLLQSAKMGFSVVYNKILDILDSFTGYKLPILSRSLKSVSVKNKIQYQEINNPNDQNFLDELRALSPDLVVSYSAPLIFRKELLSIPKHGCINLHCSHLPSYAGVMPSFWTLYNGEKNTGVTVHYMDSKIDNGKILGQKTVSISPNETMFTLIKKTKEIGGNVMCEVLSNIHNNTLEVIDNKVDQDKYYSWPTVENFKDFRKKGGRLI